MRFSRIAVVRIRWMERRRIERCCWQDPSSVPDRRSVAVGAAVAVGGAAQWGRLVVRGAHRPGARRDAGGERVGYLAARFWVIPIQRLPGPGSLPKLPQGLEDLER